MTLDTPSTSSGTSKERKLQECPWQRGTTRTASCVLSFLNYSLMFGGIQSLLNYEEHKPVVTAAASEDDQLVGFGTRAYSTWREVWESREDGYASFILKKKNCTAGTKMHKLQLYLKKKLQPPTVTPLMSHTSPVMSHASHAPAEAIVMDEDEELERMMLSISPSKQHVQSSVSASSSSSSSARTRKRSLTQSTARRPTQLGP
ncbi:uncharacterized protein LOC130191699 [Pseudoliparis swirei]|uniref:uncharacterized protein LOC130191699 n=1 Tax=Pseudoliparis swirei TaxID=2059687 RepID=UPI0024BF0887|nr:uncharacterized protein LOC130191699 [Pseudoliparis swirei]